MSSLFNPSEIHCSAFINSGINTPAVKRACPCVIRIFPVELRFNLIISTVSAKALRTVESHSGVKFGEER